MSDCRTTMRASSVQETQSQNVDVLGLCDITRCTKPFTAPKKHNDLHICFGLCQRWRIVLLECESQTLTTKHCCCEFITSPRACVGSLIRFFTLLWEYDCYHWMYMQNSSSRPLMVILYNLTAWRYVWNGNVERLPKEHYTSGKKSIPMNINVVFPQ